ncbi:MAG: hypothetical protein PWQ60_862 [Thermoanaerobacteraceae bacterium]|nr:hypothetical protein [Thermoanaerobacteraceae bacterium]MDN5312766.1 hypothetical protein [Thermoanaerobacteraceae bacterium]RKL62567.1 hypothetical protein DXT63_11070 [Thermoanaerobacteraceae bacterium SP2]
MNDLVDKKIERYETLLREMWAASEKYLGAFSVKLLVERVVWDISTEYREIELLHYDEGRISCAEMAASMKENPNLPVDDMFMKFITRYVEILARLIGCEKADKIAKKLKEEFGNIPFDSKEE